MMTSLTLTTATAQLPAPRAPWRLVRALYLILAAMAVGSAGLWVPMANEGRSFVPDGAVAAAPAAAVPSLALTVLGDPGAGWTLEIDAENFLFQSEATEAAADGRPLGHAHVYINGEKAGMSWWPSFHIGLLEPGRHEVTVTLNTPDHQAIGTLLSEIVVIEVPETVPAWRQMVGLHLDRLGDAASPGVAPPPLIGDWRAEL